MKNASGNCVVDLRFGMKETFGESHPPRSGGKVEKVPAAGYM